MTVRKRGAHWHYDFQIEGVRYRAAIPSARNKSDAETEETKKRAEVLEGRFEKPKKVPTLNEFAKIYSDWARGNKASWKSDETHLKTLKAKFGKLQLNQITRFAIEKLKSELQQTTTRRRTVYAPSSVNRLLHTLSKLMTLAHEDELIKTNPVRLVKKLPEDNERTRYLTTEEETKLLEVLDDEEFDQIRPIVLIALNTGIRLGGLLKLEWRDVNFTSKTICVRHNKKGKKYFVEMNETSFLVLLDLQVSRTSGKTVFGRKCIRRAWKKACDLAGLENFNFHDLRHTVGTKLDEAGASANVIKEILGHARLETTRHYVHASDERKRAFLEKIKPTVTKLSQSAEK